MRLLALVTLLTVQIASAQTITAAQASQYEKKLKVGANDRAARAALMEFYFRNASVPPAQAIPARRNHILWMIQNAPSDPLAGAPSATIDASGHRLADPEGFRLASEAWKAQVSNRPASQTLINAAYFFKLSDGALTVTLLEQAIALDPNNPEAGARLGDQYAARILGITMVNSSTYPTAMDPARTASAEAKQARTALETSTNPYMLSKAGYMLAFQGSILRQRLGFDPYALAEKALDRALSQAPGQQDIAQAVRLGRELIAQGRGALKR